MPSVSLSSSTIISARLHVGQRDHHDATALLEMPLSPTLPTTERLPPSGRLCRSALLLHAGFLPSLSAPAILAGAATRAAPVH